MIKVSDSVVKDLVEEIDVMLQANPPVPPEEFKERISRLVQRTQITAGKQSDLFHAEEQLTIEGS